MGNNNLNAEGAVGIEIEIQRRNNLPVVESVTENRFKILSYDELTNFCVAEEVVDDPPPAKSARSKNDTEASVRAKVQHQDLIQSELFELKNLWFTYNKKINSLVAILPQEMLSRVSYSHHSFSMI